VQEIGAVRHRGGPGAAAGEQVAVEEAGRRRHARSNLGGSRPAPCSARLKVALLDAIYPPRCLTCPAETEAPHGLCPACWRDTHFIAGAACWSCGLPLVGEAEAGDLCDGCLRHPPAWDRGRAATSIAAPRAARSCALKHGDRLDMAPARWRAGWRGGRRAARRGRRDRAGAAALAAADPAALQPVGRARPAAGRRAGQPVVPDLLTPARMTVPQERMDRARATPTRPAPSRSARGTRPPSTGGACCSSTT
jgi:hypothetical protein